MCASWSTWTVDGTGRPRQWRDRSARPRPSSGAPTGSSPPIASPPIGPACDAADPTRLGVDDREVLPDPPVSNLPTYTDAVVGGDDLRTAAADRDGPEHAAAGQVDLDKIAAVGEDDPGAVPADDDRARSGRWPSRAIVDRVGWRGCRPGRRSRPTRGRARRRASVRSHFATEPPTMIASSPSGVSKSEIQSSPPGIDRQRARQIPA